MNICIRMTQLAIFGLSAALVCLVGQAAAAPTGSPADTAIRVLSAAGVNATKPEAAIWKKAPATQITLQPAFQSYVSIVGTAVTKRVTVQAVRSGGRLFIKLTWRAPTASSAIKDTTQFVDAVAVEFPITGKAATSPFMGDESHAVNIWYWSAEGHIQNLFAKGFGTTTIEPLADLHSAAVRTGRGWAVVFVRPLRVGPDEGVNLQGRGSIPVAFAVWNGANRERDGKKAVTLEWQQLRF